MNIKEAKEEIKHTLLAYNRKDAAGRYTFPRLRQRPILLMALRESENRRHGAGGRGMRSRAGSLYHHPPYKTECGRTAQDRDPVL